MRHEFSVTVTYYDGKQRTFFFFTSTRANAFRAAMEEFRAEMNILYVGAVRELHPQNVWPPKDLYSYLQLFTEQ